MGSPTFQAQGLEFRKSSKSDTDWTRQCVGVHVAPASLTAHVADSVTKQVLRLPGRELLHLLHSVR